MIHFCLPLYFNRKVAFVCLSFMCSTCISMALDIDVYRWLSLVDPPHRLLLIFRERSMMWPNSWQAPPVDWLLLDAVHPKLTTERSILCPGAPSITQGDWGEPQLVSSVTELDKVPGHVSSFSGDAGRHRLPGVVTEGNSHLTLGKECTSDISHILTTWVHYIKHHHHKALNFPDSPILNTTIILDHVLNMAFGIFVCVWFRWMQNWPLWHISIAVTQIAVEKDW